MGEVIEFKKNSDKYIEELHNYYLNNINILGHDILSDDVFSNIDSILLIKGFEDDAKNKYIKIVDDIKSLKRGALDEIKSVSDVTELFLYLEDDVNDYDISSLKNMFAYKNINKVDIEEAVSIIDSDYSAKRMN